MKKQKNHVNHTNSIIFIIFGCKHLISSKYILYIYILHFINVMTCNIISQYVQGERVEINNNLTVLSYDVMYLCAIA